MQRPKVSVITVNFNGARYLERTLCSVLDQPGANIEIIVVDGGSTDGSDEIIGYYLDEINRVVMARGLNRPMAINEGLDRATGDWVAIVDSGDVLLPRAFDRVMHMNKPWLAGAATLLDSRDFELGAVESHAPKSAASYLMRNTGRILPGASLWRRELFTEYGVFDSSLPHAADYEWHCRLLHHGIEPQIISAAICGMRETQPASAAATLNHGEELIEVAQRYLVELSRADQLLVRQNLDERRRIYALAHAELYPHDARRLLWQQLKSHPSWITDATFRAAMVHGPAHPAPASLRRVA